MLEYYYLPKIIGFAETAWSDRDWETIEIGMKGKRRW
ncbi:MAG: hypothetical protein CM1200mP10_25660 [Candidatus Neomarinimicrobiota bacterium]|nr:MAG: hypothetical protein CM1200mP10_25660 [Candidatus Neomarinimicrobiota bacterium]